MTSKLKAVIKKIPILGSALVATSRLTKKFKGSQDYWESRYSAGGNSGCGSYGELATFKADFLNTFVAEKKIKSVVEFGCGDGNQLTLSSYPNYIGVDVAQSAIDRCKKLFANDDSKSFMIVDEFEKNKNQFKFEMAISLDVIYHLVENEVYDDYMKRLFAASNRYVIIYSSNVDQPTTLHVRHRNFSNWVEINSPDFKLIQFIKNKYPYKGINETGSLANFYIYENKSFSILS
jgi:cyclopropane fatty-acyl-phospholipid synthase-like methyltransferase